jgi:hypothetical protein
MIVERYRADFVQEEGKKPYFVLNPKGEWNIVEFDDKSVMGYINQYQIAGFQMTVKKGKDDA